MLPTTLTVNNKDYVINVTSDTPLLWALRDILGLTGTKYSCGIGVCGACTVHLEGEAVHSCSIPVSDVVGKAITTIEGLAPNGNHPVQQAWLAENVPQCGYCQSGQIMSAAALLAKNNAPSDDDINETMTDNLCRCGTYQRIRRAIHLAAVNGMSSSNQESTDAHISPVGSASMASLLPVVGAMVISKVGAKAQVSRRDFLKISSMASAGLLISISLPGCNTPPPDVASSGATSTVTVPPLPKPTNVPSTTPEPKPIPSRTTPPNPTATLAPEATEIPATATGVPTPLPTPVPTSEPTAWFQPSVYLEIDSNGVVTITAHRSEMGQGIKTSLAMIIAEELDADWSNIRVVQGRADPKYGNQDTHGSLSISESYSAFRLAGAVARMMLVSAAAQIWGVQEEECSTLNGMVIHQTSNQQLSYGELAETAATLPVPHSSGVTFKDPVEYRFVGTNVSSLDNPQLVDGSAAFGMDIQLPGMVYATVARCPVFGGRVASFDASEAEKIEGVLRIDQIENWVAVTANNSWAAMQGRKALEIAWDEGRNAGLNSNTVNQWYTEHSSIAQNNQREAQLEAVYGMPFLAHTTMSPMNCVAHVAEDFCEVWAPTQRPATAKNQVKMITGLPDDAITVHIPLIGGGFGRRREADYVAEAVQISKVVNAPVKLIWTRDDDIQHDFYHPLSFQHVRTHVDKPDQYQVVSAQTLSGIPTAAWRSASNLTPAFVRECFFDEVAAHAGKDPYELRMQMPRYNKLKGVLEVAATQSGWGSSMPDGWGRGIAAHSTWDTSHVAEVVEVSVNQDGEVRVHRVVCAIDCGTVINPDMIAAQMEGGIVYGLSAALKGEITIDNGRVQQSNFHDYPMLRIDEMPVVEVYILPSDRAPQGVGEMSVPPIIPALLNAIFQATGKRIRRLPVRPDDFQQT